MGAFDVTAVIPTIPPRAELLLRAIRSITLQTAPVAAVSVATDLSHHGAGATRQRGLEAARTPWTAFLDDDDEWEPEHIARMLACAQETGADFVYSWYHLVADGKVDNDRDPRPTVFGQPFDPANPVQTTIVTLVRTELAQTVGFPAEPVDQLTGPDRMYCGEDWAFTKGVNDVGGKIVHLPERTWRWHHWGPGRPGKPGNTSGLPHRW